MLSLGMDLLEPLDSMELLGLEKTRVAKPHSANADQDLAKHKAARPRDALQREPPWSEEWVKREERVSSMTRRHVIMIRANSGNAAARRKAQSRLGRG